MKEYIDKAVLIAMCKCIAAHEWNKKVAPVSWADAYERFADEVEEFDAADVVERKRGELGEKAKDAFGSIAWYNGHYEWLCNLADKIEAKADGFFCDPPEMEWLTDRHALWMMLVGMFGDWCTSIRSGWIEDKKAAVAFIREATQEYRDALEEEVEHAAD